jgi:hypothetical protein
MMIETVTLMTEKELLEIVDQILRDKTYNRPAAVQIAMAVGAAVEAEVRQRAMTAEREACREAVEECIRTQAHLACNAREALSEAAARIFKRGLV